MVRLLNTHLLSSKCLKSTKRILAVSCAMLAMHSLLTAEAGSLSLAITNVDDTSSEWKSKIALSQVEMDIEKFLYKYDRDRAKLQEVVENFRTFPVATGGIRKVPQYGKAFAFLLETLPSEHKHHEELYDNLIAIGRQLTSTYTEEYSFVENAVMRGWPMRRRDDNLYKVHEGFNFGNIAHAVALAANQAAHQGEHKTAAELLQPVLGAIFDNVLTPDPMKRKVDDLGRLNRVPTEAPEDRFKRYKTLGDEEYCLDVPEQYNHGTALAQAAIAAHRTIEAINWDKVDWTLEDLNRKEYRDQLWEYIRKNGKWIKNGLSIHPEKTGENKKDNYPGKKGTAWYTWKYRDLDECKEYKGSAKDRPQDIWKGSKELSFITDFFKWANENPKGGDPESVKKMYEKEDIHRLVVTYLNRLTRTMEGNATERFACDIHGTVEGDPEVYAPKSCEGRPPADRPFLAAAWLSIAWAANDMIGKDRALTCDVNNMVKTVLPLTMEGNKEFYPDSFDVVSRDWASEIIMAKYYYYNYDFSIKKACSSSKDDDDDDKGSSKDD